MTDLIRFSKEYTQRQAEDWLKGKGYKQFEFINSSTKHHKYLASKDVVGGSVWSEIVRHYKGVRDALKGTRKGFNKNMRDMLSRVGDLPIKKIVICRKPIKAYVSSLVKMVRTITDWHGSEYSKLFHLQMLMTLSDGKVYVVEKNQYLNLIPYKAESFDEMKPVPIKEGLTINGMLKQAINKVGEEQIYHYRSDTFNCQRFVMDMLESSGLEVSNDLKTFIMQDVKNLVPHFAQRIINVATDLGNRSEEFIHGHGPESTSSKLPLP